MKIPHLLLAVLAVGLVLLSGNHQMLMATPSVPQTIAPISAPNSPLTDRAISIDSPGDSPGGRSTATLPAALLGHWASEDGRIHSYFSERKAVVVTQLRRQTQNLPDYQQAMPYEINSVNESTNRLNVRMVTRSGWAQARQLHFSGDRQTFTESMSILGHSFGSEWHYVDSQQLPPLNPV